MTINKTTDQPNIVIAVHYEPNYPDIKKRWVVEYYHNGKITTSRHSARRKVLYAIGQRYLNNNTMFYVVIPKNSKKKGHSNADKS